MIHWCNEDQGARETCNKNGYVVLNLILSIVFLISFYVLLPTTIAKASTLETLECFVKNESELRDAIKNFSEKNLIVTFEDNIHLSKKPGQAVTLKIDGNVTLKGNYKLICITNGDVITVSYTGNVTIDGITITHSDDSYGFGADVCGKMTLKSGCISNNNGYCPSYDGKGGRYIDGGGLSVRQNGTFIMNGGEIAHNNGYGCGGIENHGRCTINAGTIVDNKSSTGGGGIHNGGVLKMHGGTIERNSAKFDGGGVYSNHTFSIYGGVINNNSASGDGGGIYVRDRLNIFNGRISNNFAKHDGGGIYLSDSYDYESYDYVLKTRGKIVMKDGEISGNRSTDGGGVCSSATFVIKGGRIFDNYASEYGGGVCDLSDKRLKIEVNSIIGNNAGMHSKSSEIYKFSDQNFKITLNGIPANLLPGQKRKFSVKFSEEHPFENVSIAWIHIGQPHTRPVGKGNSIVIPTKTEAYEKYECSVALYNDNYFSGYGETDNYYILSEQEFKIGFDVNVTRNFNSKAAYIEAALGPGMVLNAPDSLKPSTKHIKIEKKSNRKTQKYKFVRDKNGFYKIKSINSGGYLTVSGGKAKPGAAVGVANSSNSKAQKFKITYAGNNSYVILSALDERYCLDLKGDSIKNGTKLIIKKHSPIDMYQYFKIKMR